MINHIKALLITAVLISTCQSFVFGQHVRGTVTKKQEKEALNQAKIILQEMKDGGDFEKLAMQYSDDVVSARRGGDMGFAKPGQMVAEFEKAAMALKPGQISKPVKTEFGYHIIQLIAVTSDAYHTRHILIRPD